MVWIEWLETNRELLKKLDAFLFKDGNFTYELQAGWIVVKDGQRTIANIHIDYI